MPHYRKKPVVIEAHQLILGNGEYLSCCSDTKCAVEICEWIGGESYVEFDKNTVRIGIPTLEGSMIASEGDWIIKGVNGEFYPCKPDIFEKTYELVE